MNQRIEKQTVTELLGKHFAAGAAAGLLLFLLEAVDQFFVLPPSFQSGKERVFYLSLLLVTVAGAISVSLLAALGALGLSGVARLILGGEEVSESGHPVSRVKRALIASVVLLVYAILLAFIFRGPLASDLTRVAAVYVPDAVSRGHRSFGPIATGILVLVVLVFLVMVRQSYILLGETFSPRLRWGLLLLALVAIGFSYRLDSRFHPGLHEPTLHRVLFWFELVAGLIVGLVGVQMIRRREATRPRLQWVRRGLIVCGVAAMVTALIGLNQLGSDESLRALFMHRSVVARRFVAFIGWVSDRDGDGFSAILGGGDCDDRNPAIHPAAAEIPGNGIDENCLGGDLMLNEQEKQFLVNARLEESAPKGGGEGSGGNIVLITIDALRADHVSCYGSSRATSPNMDRLAHQSAQFLRAHSPSTSTGHSFAVMLKSAQGEAVFDDHRKTFIEILADHGYQTAFIQHRDIDKQLNLQPPYQRMPKAGLVVDRHPGEDTAWTATELTDQAIDYLKTLEHNERQFIWIHYYELNPPYLKQAGFDFGNRPIDRYDGEIAYTDSQLQRLFQILEGSGWSGKTMIIITSDHGEAFFEHGQSEHDTMPYQETVHIPLIIHYPGRASERVETPVGLVDVAPTILGFAGIQPPDWYEGRDLFSADGRAPRPIFVETSRTTPGSIYFTYAMIDEEWKIIYDFVANTFEVYNLRDDPHERRNLVEIDRERSAELKHKLTRWIDLKSLHPVRSDVWSVRALLR